MRFSVLFLDAFWPPKKRAGYNFLAALAINYSFETSFVRMYILPALENSLLKCLRGLGAPPGGTANIGLGNTAKADQALDNCGILKCGQYRLLRLFFFLVILVILPLSFAPLLEAEEAVWRRLEKGVFLRQTSFLRADAWTEVDEAIVRLDPTQVGFKMVFADLLKQERASIVSLVNASKGFLGINTNFFDKKGRALGLVVDQGKVLQPIHRGGSLLTGIFSLDSSSIPRIVHRSSYVGNKVQLAFQAGPRLIVDSKPLEINSASASRRRSVIAVTKDGKILLFVFLGRFRGIKLQDVQKRLLEPTLKVVDALNLDGGSSSQLFIPKNKSLEKELLISGSSPIPVALVVTPGGRR